MAYQKLQIKLLSPAGELLNCINCNAGRITVLRGYTATDLQPYQRALSGVPGAEKFALVVDQQTFNPAEHILVGFGEQKPESQSSLREYLLTKEVPGAIDSLLLTYGLEKTALKSCSDLSEDEFRRVQLLLALQQNEKILILNNPFDPLAGQWKERFAENLATHVRNKNCIAVVSSLNYRPDCWINNETIARIQVGENIQKTIGFGSDASSSAAMIQQMRAMLKESSQTPKAPVPPSNPKVHFSEDPVLNTSGKITAINSPTQDTHAQSTKTVNSLRAASKVLSKPASKNKRKFDATKLNKKLKIGAVGVLALLLCLIVVNYNSTKGSLPATASLPEQQLPRTPIIESQAKTDLKDDQPLPNSNREIKNKAALTEPAEAKSKPAVLTLVNGMPNFLLDQYPAEIKNSVMQVFTGMFVPETRKLTNRAANPEQQETKAEPSGGFWDSLQATSGSPENSAGETAASNVSSSADATANYDPADQEARRELIRQKFLEAIAKASEQPEQ